MFYVKGIIKPLEEFSGDLIEYEQRYQYVEKCKLKMILLLLFKWMFCSCVKPVSILKIMKGYLLPC